MPKIMLMKFSKKFLATSSQTPGGLGGLEGLEKASQSLRKKPANCTHTPWRWGVGHTLSNGMVAEGREIKKLWT